MFACLNFGKRMNVRPGGDLELRVHDALVGITVAGSGIGGMFIKELAYIGIVTGALMALSFITGFCPVHFLLKLLGFRQSQVDTTQS